MPQRFSINFFSSEKKPFSLEYKVLEHSAAQKWYRIFKQQTLADLQKNREVFNGFGSTSDIIEKKIQRLNELIDQLNTFVTPRIGSKFDSADPQKSLNQLHIHFPEQMAGSDESKKKFLAEYNSVIHHLELLFLKNSENNEFGKHIAFLALCFNKSEQVPIDPEEFKLFEPGRFFGDVASHYPHIGKHAIEIYRAQDLTVPKDQIICQYNISASSTFYFGSGFIRTPEEKALFNRRFQRFYGLFENGHWPYNPEDPRLAIGTIPVARLEKDYNAPEEIQESYRKMLDGASLESVVFLD